MDTRITEQELPKCEYVCNCGPECDDYRCEVHHAPDIAFALEEQNKAKKLLKRWCTIHRSAYYGECTVCIAVEIRNLLKRPMK